MAIDEMRTINLSDSKVTFDRETGEFAIDGIPVRLLSDLDEATKRDLGLSEFPDVYRVFAMVNLADTYVNPAYQRGKIETKIEAMEPFNPIAAGTLLGAYDPEHVDGRMRFISVMDGQQRGERARREGIQRFGFAVYFGLTREQQAEVFAICNTNNEGATAFDVFKARLYAGNEQYKEVHEILMKHRIKVLPSVASPNNYETKAIGTIIRLYDQFGPVYLDRLLTLLVNAWSGYRMTLSEYFIKSVHAVLQAYDERIDDERLAAVLSEQKADQLYIEASTESTLRMIRNYKPEVGIGRAKRQAISRILAEMFVDLYNRKLRGEHLNKQELDPYYRRSMKAKGKRQSYINHQTELEFAEEELDTEEERIAH